MVKKALELLPSLQAQFIITGEVLYQRPKSQKMGGLMAVAKDSGAQDLILRPLSAKLLPPTKPEEKAGLTAPYCWTFKEDLAKGSLI